jgi:hypothetical protein
MTFQQIKKVYSSVLISGFILLLLCALLENSALPQMLVRIAGGIAVWLPFLCSLIYVPAALLAIKRSQVIGNTGVGLLFFAVLYCIISFFLIAFRISAMPIPWV